MSSELKDLIAKAETLFDQEKYEDLIALLPDNVLEKQKAIELYFWRTRAHFKQDELELGYQYAEKTISCEPTNWMAIFTSGVAWRNKGEYDKAISDYSRAVVLKPDNASAYFNRGCCFSIMNEDDKAINDYSKAIDLEPDYAHAYHNRGCSYGKNGNWDKAIDDYSKSIELKQEDAVAYLNRGIAYYEQGDYNKAIDDLNKSIDLQPDSAITFRYRGLSYHDKGDYNEAINNYTKAIDLKTDYTHAFNNRGLSYNNKGDYERAINDFTWAIHLDPQYAFAYYNRGISSYQKGDYDSAIIDYTVALDLEPYDAEVFNNRGLCYSKKGEYDSAIVDYSKAIYLKSDFALAYTNRGALYTKKGQFDKAILDFTKVIDLDSYNASAYHNRGNAYLIKHDFEKAIVDFNKSIELKPDFANAYSSRGNVRITLNQFELAKRDVDSALCFPVTSAWNYAVKGLFEQTVGNFGNAVLYFNRAVMKKGLSNQQVIDLIAKFYSSGYPFMAHRLLDRSMNTENYSGLNTYIGQIVQDCKPIKQWLMHMHRQSDMWTSPTEYLKWMGIINFYMGDAVTAFRIFDLLDGTIDNDFQLKYYCLKAAMLVYPPLPDTTDLDSYLRGYEKDALQYIVKEDFDEEQYHYALLILFHAGRAQEVSNLIPHIYLQSTQYVASWAAAVTGHDEQAKVLLSEENMKHKISDFHIPFKKVVVPKERLMELTDDERAKGEKQIDLWLNNLRRVVRYYEIESEFNEVAAQNKEVLRFWDAWDLSLLSDVHRKQLGKELVLSDIEEKEKKIMNSAEGKKPERQAISEDPVQRSWVDAMMNHSSKEFLLNDMYGHIKKGKKGFDYKTCFRVIEYLYLNQKISSNDFVMLSVYAAIMYYIPVDLVMDRMEQATSPLTGKMVEFIFEDVPSSYVNGLNKFVFAKMKMITQKLLEEKIEDYNALKEVLLERLSEEQIVLSEQELIFDEFPLSHFEDIEKLAAYAGYN